jgi:hypothetical protein
MRYAICEVIPEWCPEQDREFKRVARVLQVFDSKEDAEAAEEIFNPYRYNDYDTSIRVVPEDKLDSSFR